jgi:hypothetical protein
METLDIGKKMRELHIRVKAPEIRTRADEDEFGKSIEDGRAFGRRVGLGIQGWTEPWDGVNR